MLTPLGQTSNHQYPKAQNQTQQTEQDDKTKKTPPTQGKE